MSTRQISDEQQRWLARELTEWQSGGLITPDQAARILANYESAGERGERKHSVFIFVIQSFSAFLVGLALLLLIGYNWDDLPRAAKLLIIFGVTLGTHAAGLYLRFVRAAPRASELVMFLGCLFYGAGIWLVAQVFHLEAHYPDGVWWWAIGVLPFALCLDTLLLHCLLVALLGLWSGMEVIGFSNLGVRLFWGPWMLPNAAYSLPVLALPGLIWAYRKNSPIAVGLYAPLLAWWIVLQPLAWDLEWQTVYFVGIVGALFLIVAEAHRSGSPFAAPIRAWGLALVAGTLVPLSFGHLQQDLVRRSSSIGWAFFGDAAQLCASSVLIAATLVICSYFARREGRGEPASARLMSLIKRQCLPLALAVGLSAMSLWAMIASESGIPANDRIDWLIPTIAANAAMIGLALWVMRVGLREDRGLPFAFGVMYFLLWSILRYVDLFAEQGGMLGAALMFLLCGAALFGVGMFWRGRKVARHA
ncbi:MAG TPA: DUF2157 domain-containing protein [Planctomycetaceae bacterium]|nr:DUF2157 domain-containing protein [Planctomycetaceae bacterium]